MLSFYLASRFLFDVPEPDAKLQLRIGVASLLGRNQLDLLQLSQKKEKNETRSINKTKKIRRYAL